MMKLEIEVSDQRITDLLHGHGAGSSPWMHELSGRWNKGGAKVRFDDETGDEGNGKGRRTIGRAAVSRGLEIFAKKCPTRFADWMNENDDELAFDTAWQCIIFGKVIYG